MHTRQPVGAVVTVHTVKNMHTVTEREPDRPVDVLLNLRRRYGLG